VEEGKADSRWKNGRKFAQREPQTKTQFLEARCCCGGVRWIIGTAGDAESKGVTFLEGPPEIPEVRCKPEYDFEYPFVISTMKKMVPKVARAVSAVTFLQKFNGKSCKARGQQLNAELLGSSAQCMYSINASAGFGIS